MVMTTHEILEKFSKDTDHSNEVSRLALIIFDGVNATLKEMTDKHRKYLEHAALLHDIGYSIASKDHHKHSQKMILEYGLDNFTEREKEIISCICRYHRGSLPDKKEHNVYCNFDKKERKIVKRLAGILRIADGLDIKHVRQIKNLDVKYDVENNITSIIITPMTPEFLPDISYAVRKKDLFEIGFKTQVIFMFAG